MTDEAIEKFLHGDISAFNTIVWRWQKPICNFAYRYVGELELAKEVTQKTFIRVYKNLHRLKDASRFSTWLHQIALNICRDELKKGKRRFISVHDLESGGEMGNYTPGELRDDPNQRPDAHAHKQQLAAILKKALEEIPEEQRVVVIMKEYQGLKFNEIAEILNEPLNTVKSRMYYGLTALRKVLSEWNIQREELGYEM